MPTHKLFKQRVRARMTKTGESYTAARHQLLRKASEPATAPTAETVADAVVPAARAGDATAAAATADGGPGTLTSDDAMVRGSGRTHAAWFELLDGWGATSRPHAEIARWLREAHGVAGWWAQNITVAYERVRGNRAAGQMANGFQVAVTRTVAADAAVALAAIVDEEQRRAWLPDAPMTRRPTRAAGTARYDWSNPPSRVVVTVLARADGRSTVAIVHEKLPDRAAADRLKASWREWLDALKAFLGR